MKKQRNEKIESKSENRFSREESRKYFDRRESERHGDRDYQEYLNRERDLDDDDGPNPRAYKRSESRRR